MKHDYQKKIAAALLIADTLNTGSMRDLAEDILKLADAKEVRQHVDSIASDHDET